MILFSDSGCRVFRARHMTSAPSPTSTIKLGGSGAEGEALVHLSLRGRRRTSASTTHKAPLSRVSSRVRALHDHDVLQAASCACCLDMGTPYPKYSNSNSSSSYLLRKLHLHLSPDLMQFASIPLVPGTAARCHHMRALFPRSQRPSLRGRTPDLVVCSTRRSQAKKHHR